LHDTLRVENGRYWSYACQDPRCCPPEDVLFDPASYPAAEALRPGGPADAVLLAAPEMVPVPEAYRRTDGLSLGRRHGAEVYTTRAMLAPRRCCGATTQPTASLIPTLARYPPAQRGQLAARPTDTGTLECAGADHWTGRQWQDRISAARSRAVIDEITIAIRG
jgi:hypothetical protein